MIPFPLWSPEWWTVVALCALGVVALLWLLCRNSLLLQQIVWPPIIEGGHHTSKRWKTVADTHRKRTSGRCVICGCHGDRTWHLFSVERKGWGFRIISLRSTARKNPVHELIYSWIRTEGRVPRRWLKNMCTTHHTALHRFDKRLFPNDQRNRWLWLSSWLYFAGWYARYGAVIGVPAIGALWFFRPDVARHLVTFAEGIIR